MDYIWGAPIVETCLRMMIDLWEMRKEEVYGKEGKISTETKSI